MRSEELVANEVLAFLQYQLDVMDEVSVTQICTSNFNEEEIRRAKTLLFESLSMGDRMPSRRRDEKGERSLQDIIKVLKETDPDDVPTFVAKDLRKLPPVTFDHVDVTRLLRDITTLRSSLVEMQLKLEASQSTISDLRTEVADLRNTVCRSHELPANVNASHGAFNASQLSFESAKLDSSPAAVTASGAHARPALPAPPIAEAPKQVSASRAYSAAVIATPAKKQRPKQVRGTQGPSDIVRSLLPAAISQGQADEEGFVRVVKKKKKPASRNQCGTALTCPNALLRPAIPSTQLYVSRLHHSTKVEELVEYIKMKTNFILRVERLESRHKINFKSFVVRVPTHSLETFMKEEFWPKGVVYRRFRGRLHDTTTQRNTSPTQRSFNNVN
ncbi:hypothetical protein PYW07_005502 [Mythimna separata]|uniref:Mutant cadherin n=1 Tax=Mythimna separata TaxID=271217 RepID=A0AAD8DRZ2_MYTSE|nr:hypothetical protein PYW07_005502 [Mythimna separata]